MRNIFKEIIIEMVDYIKEQSRAELFWKGLVYLIFVIICVVNLDIAFLISAIGSILFIGVCFDGDIDNDLFWAPLTLIFWFFLLIFGVGFYFYFVLSWVYEKIINLFNNWLNHGKKV